MTLQSDRGSRTSVDMLDLLFLVLLGITLRTGLGGRWAGQLLGHRWSVQWPRVLAAMVIVFILRHVLRPAPSIYAVWSTRTLNWIREPPTQFALCLALITRLAIFSLGYLSMIAIGSARAAMPPGDALKNLPAHWDAAWYVGLAHGGYRFEELGHHFSRIAFFPAYPIALRVFGWLLNLGEEPLPWFWAGVAFSTACFCWALLYIYKLAGRFGGCEGSRATITLLAFYPFAIFHGQVYSESLFLLAAAGSVYCLMDNRWPASVAWGVVAGLCRPTGALVALMLWSIGIAERRGNPNGRFRITTAIAVASPLIGTAVYSAWVRLVTGQWFAWMTEQSGWGREMRSVSQLFQEVYLFMVDVPGYIAQRPFDVLNGAAAVFALASVFPVARKLGLGFGLFVLLSVIGPLRVGGIASMGRYTSVLFPIFVWLGNTRPEFRHPVVLGIFAMGEAFTASLFFTDRPIY